MPKFYSKTTGGFYAADMRADYEAAGTWPADAVEITADEHAALLAGQSAGKRITDANGRPALSEPPAPTAAELKAKANAAIQAQIDALERGQARAVREATIGAGGAIDRLKSLDSQIAALRAQFIK